MININNKAFFFDTANVDYIRNTWNKIKESFKPSVNVCGVTTNPNAMFKENLSTILSWQTRVQELCQLVYEIRKDPLGIVYIQAPNSEYTIDEILKFLDLFKDIGKGKVNIGIKVPPYTQIIRKLKRLNDFYPNITGVADCSTALSVGASYPYYSFVSIIPGRMEEVGIDATSHLEYASSIMYRRSIITGSMRTIDGLKRAIYANTVPTIGTRVWDSILQENRIAEVADYWNNIPPLKDYKFSPTVSEKNTQLSIDFFNQMDKAGELPAKDLAENYWK